MGSYLIKSVISRFEIPRKFSTFALTPSAKPPATKRTRRWSEGLWRERPGEQDQRPASRRCRRGHQVLGSMPPGRSRGPYRVGATAGRRPGMGFPRAATRTARRSGRTYVHGRGPLSSAHSRCSHALPGTRDRPRDTPAELAATAGNVPPRGPAWGLLLCAPHHEILSKFSDSAWGDLRVSRAWAGPPAASPSALPIAGMDLWLGLGQEQGFTCSSTFKWCEILTDEICPHDRRV